MLSYSKLIGNYFFIVFLLVIAVSNTAKSAPLTGQITVDPKNAAWLVYQGGGAHFLAAPGDPEDFLYRGTRNNDGTRTGDQMEIINKLKTTGANGIYLQAVRSHGGDGDATHNPFINNDPAQGLNTTVLSQWESWFTAMDNSGIVIYFFFYDDSARIWNTGDAVGADEKIFLETLVNRFEHHKNLIWVVAEEYAEVYSPARTSNIAAVIRAADDRQHVIAVHKNIDLDFDEFATDPNIDQFAIQRDFGNSAASLHSDMVTAWNKAAGRFNNNMSEAPEWGTGITARHKAWAVAMGGAYVMGFGMDIASTPTGDLEDLGRLVRFMESTNFNEMAPHDELAFGGTQYVLARPGHSYIAYAANLSSNIGLQNLAAGTYDFKWFNPATGATVVQTGIAVSSGNQSWTKPATMGNELALHIKPGTAAPITKVFPGSSWQSKAPAEVGLDAAKLDQFAANAGGNGCIVRFGYMVKCWGDSSIQQDWGSAAKPVMSTLLFFAVQEQRLTSVNDLIADWGWNLSSKDQTMTFSHLANMISGYTRGEAPGAAWAYNDYAISLYAKTLEKAYAKSLDAAAMEKFSLLQFENDSLFSSRNGYGVFASVRDFARIGWFWLNKGQWNGTQLLSASYFDNYMKPAVPNNLPVTGTAGSDYLNVDTLGGPSDQTPFGPGIYGYNWWFNTKVGTTSSLHWPNAPADTFQANGHWGVEVVTVIPSLNMVVAFVSDQQGGLGFDPGSANSKMNINLKLLSDAVIGNGGTTTTLVPPSPPTGLKLQVR